MTPHHWHATAAAWALHQARGTLVTRATDEARQRGELLIAAGPISSPTYGSRHAVGGHADPVSDSLALEHGPTRDTTWTDLLRRSNDRLDWIACQLGDTTGFTPMDRILIAIENLQPGTARLVARHLADEDAWVRGLPGVWPINRRPLTGVDCPACATRQLTVQCAGPVDAWTVVCVCRCTGVGCRCGQPGAVEGVPHIWPRAAVIGAVAGATPTSPVTSTGGPR